MYFVENIFSKDEQKYLLYLSQKTLIPKEIAVKLNNYQGKEKNFISPDLRIISNYDFALNKILNKINEKLNKNLIIINSWVATTNGDKIDYHNHPDATWSSVYYLKTNEENCGTYFEKHGFIKSKINSLLIFDSKLNHRCPIYTNNETRITLAFDFLVKFKL